MSETKTGYKDDPAEDAIRIRPCGADFHRFAHDAMHTRFEIFIAGGDRIRAARAAAEAFRRLGELENVLSRFLPNSDIARIHAARAGVPVRVGADAFACLAACRELWRKTGGLFDVTTGSLTRLLGKPGPSRSEIRKARARTGMGLLDLDETEFVVIPRADGMGIDLGGFGKGYAVDRMAESLAEWEAMPALIHGGASSVRAVGQAVWPVSLSDPWTGEILGLLDLRDASLGASGLRKGRHLIHPATAAPVTEEKAVWILAAAAGEADGLSTALMLVPPGQAEDVLEHFTDAKAFVLWKEKGRRETVGAWPFQA